jgi:hypothetical protein
MTSGISPKVKYPVLLLFVAGVVLVVLSVIVDADDVRTVGLTAIGSALATLGVGYRASPGEVTTAEPEPSDVQLSPAVVKLIDSAPEVEPDLEQPEPAATTKK